LPRPLLSSNPANAHFSQAYPVVLLARNPTTYASLVSEINGSGGKAIGISTDVTDGESVKKAFGEIEKEFSDRNLAAAVYNVGGAFVKKPFLQMVESEFRAGYEANGCGFLPSSLFVFVHT
jgi:NAD(P)-dependent dehydrogenase (short-subunit alcohol dehydrogenase family)